MFSFFRKKKVRPVIVNVIDESYVLDFVYHWNTSNPIDRWWRNKHKIAFNSPEHRVVSFIDMRFEYEEDLLFRRDSGRFSYRPDTRDWMKIRVEEINSELSEEERKKIYIKEFESLDLSKYND